LIAVPVSYEYHILEKGFPIMANWLSTAIEINLFIRSNTSNSTNEAISEKDCCPLGS
jgi:hypothetical protein